MSNISEGALLWEPSASTRQSSRMAHYMTWLRDRTGLQFADYADLWRWSTDNIEAFWTSIAEYFDVRFDAQPAAVLVSRAMPGAQWFPGATLNYARYLLERESGEKPALIFQTETGSEPRRELTWRALHAQVTRLASALRELGVQPGDRVVAYAPNMPEAVIAFLATVSLGAIWSSCSPDIGASAVIDRFKQIAPKVLFAIDGYTYNGKPNDRRGVVREIAAALPELRHVIHIPYFDRNLTTDPALAVRAEQHVWPGLMTSDLAARHPSLECTAVPFDHPLWVLYSSGTTGLPKPITHSHGGILLEHLKAAALHTNLGPDDRFFWFTTTGWMMWNYLLGGLLVGGTILLYDGSPGLDEMDVLWAFAERTRMTVFGTSAAYISACIKAGLRPGQRHDLRHLKSIGSTGSPLPVEGFAWIYREVKPDVWLTSMSGGTDVCTAFVGGCPLWPVHAGEIQCRYLGAAVHAFDEVGQPVLDQVGELVVTQPMPSMPVYFWNDPGMKRYRESYFEMYPGVWRHGDWAKITGHDGLIIYGRSDSTINRMGVRMGTSEIYRAVDETPEILDSLVIDLEMLGRPSFMALFVVLRPGLQLTDALKDSIRANIRTRLSARQLPDEIYLVSDVPRTLNGKKMEVPVKKILLGMPVERAVTTGSMANPGSLGFFVSLAEQFK